MLTTNKIAISAIVAASAVSTAFVTFVMPATAATIAYAGNTSTAGLPTWTPPLSSIVTPYSVQHFTVSADGAYDFSSTVPSAGIPILPTQAAWFRQIILYTGSFNPNTPLANSPNGQGNFSTLLQTNLGTNFNNLVAGTSYFLVTTGFSAPINNSGAFNNSITGPGNITLSSIATAVPEPFTILGSLIGGGAAMRMRRKLVRDGKTVG
jgi:hypothetical protein